MGICIKSSSSFSYSIGTIKVGHTIIPGLQDTTSSRTVISSLLMGRSENKYEHM